MTRRRQARTSAETGRGARALKWLGAVTAVISLILGARQLTTWIGDSLERRREAATQIALAQQQAARGAFAEAWQSLDRAEALDSGDRVGEARVDVAFAWLQDARPGPGKPFSVITDPVLPALDRALLTARGSRRADLLAHAGWAAFLRSRDGAASDPAARYREALDVDASNPYANAMLGHWLLWTGGSIDEARVRFDAALAHAGDKRGFVRRLQLAALGNRGQSGDVELLRVADEMRRQGEPIDSGTADRVFGVFRFRYGRSTPDAPRDTNMTVANLAATYDWIVQASPAAGRSGGTEVIRDHLKRAASAPP